VPVAHAVSVVMHEEAIVALWLGCCSKGYICIHKMLMSEYKYLVMEKCSLL
jgi:hypothetical protein